jgi:hypothetical protein
MKLRAATRHLRVAFHWSAEADADAVAVLGAALGMAVPVLYGVVSGDIAVGLSLATASLFIGGIGAHASARGQIATLVAVSIPSALAALAAAAFAGHGRMSDLAIILLAAAVGLVAALGRPVAPMAFRFILVLVLASGINAAEPKRFLTAMAVGALWAAGITIVLGAAARAAGYPGDDPVAPLQGPWRARLKRWRYALASRRGWQYTVRLTSCLAIAAVLRGLWPAHHLHWIALTVVLLTEWPIEPLPVRITQRALGTAIGVLATGVLAIAPLPPWALLATLALLAGARPLTRQRNYLAYCTVMTPLIVLVLDAGRPVDPGLLRDRLVATVIGALLVVGANAAVGRWVGKPAPEGGG